MPHSSTGISTITSELFLHNINIIEMVTLIPELIIIIDNKQLLDAYNAIINLINGRR